MVFGIKKKQNFDENNISYNLDLSTNVSKTDLEILQKLFYSHCCSWKRIFCLMVLLQESSNCEKFQFMEILWLSSYYGNQAIGGLPGHSHHYVVASPWLGVGLELDNPLNVIYSSGNNNFAELLPDAATSGSLDYGLHILEKSVPANYYSLLKMLLMVQWKIIDAYFSRQANKKFSTFHSEK